MTGVVQDDLDAVWRQFSADLRASVLRRVATPDDADDITQLVFLRMIERATGISGGLLSLPLVDVSTSQVSAGCCG